MTIRFVHGLIYKIQKYVIFFLLGLHKKQCSCKYLPFQNIYCEIEKSHYGRHHQPDYCRHAAQQVYEEFEHRWDVCRASNGSHIYTHMVPKT